MESEKNTDEDAPYHERQQKELCALHVLNNLFQDKNPSDRFTKKDLDDICIRLSPDSFINPHRSFLGLGNYDVNVIMSAVQRKGCETVWFDKRKSINSLIFENIVGFILNIPTDYRLGFVRIPLHRKHWIAIRKLQGLYCNLDSKLESPETIGTEEELKDFLKSQLDDVNKELLLVVHSEISESGRWRKDSIEHNDNKINHF
ncbi:hypothetical protein LOTGIDRAFT_177803 [Lottia gigantea]|uniref:Josephin-2 n=1 Tax=Lottia gigantea TaxID=225164 RepID=V4BE23_LOTGI|nr:hypothetical protein LOTGIDRAFT_177803 [Lottia gigantea]ESP04017.1 hypothetical protein LOTGIDRAFT_177803 [Lottia gigantea]